MDSTTETTSTKETALSLRALLTHRHLIASFAASVAMAATVGIFALGWIDKLADVPMSYDEARHAYHLTRTASLLASGQIAEFFSIGFEQITYPPGYSWLAAPVVLLTGTLPVTLRTLNLLWYLLAALTAWFAGSSLARFQPGLAGFISAGLVLTSAPLLLYASQGLLDSAGLLLVFITLYMYAKLRSNSSRVHAVGVGLLVAIAFAIKYPFGVFLGAGLSAATIIEHIRARRWRPERIALWMLASAALFVTAILMLPGRFSDAVWYNTLQIQNTELWSVDNLSYYGRSMVEQYSVSPLVGWAVVLAAGLALFLPHRRGSFRWAVFFWIGFIALTLKLENQPRHGYVVLPAAFVVAGPLIADGFDRVLRIFTGSVQRHSFHWGQLQFRFTTTTKIGHWQALGVVSVAAVLLVSSALINLQQRVDTFPILLALSYRADALAAQKIFGEVESGGNSNELYEFVSDSIDDLAPRVVILNTFNELNAPAIGWQLAHDRFGKAGTGTYIWPRHAYEGAPNDYAAFRARIISDQVEYIVFLRDARFGSPHWEQNGFTWNLRHDLALVATGNFDLTIVPDDVTIHRLLANFRFSIPELEGRIRGRSKYWPHVVDVFRFIPDGFTDTPLPNLHALLDLPLDVRNYSRPDPQNAIGAEFGGKVELVGYDLQADGPKLELTFHWQGREWMNENYHIFIHMLAPDSGELVFGHDFIPSPEYPIQWWAPEEVISETIMLDLSSVPAGDYRLGIGIYDFETGQRLPASLANRDYSDGWLPLDENFEVN